MAVYQLAIVILKTQYCQLKKYDTGAGSKGTAVLWGTILLFEACLYGLSNVTTIAFF